MTTLLRPQTNDVFSNMPGLPPLNDPSQFWLSPLNISQDSKDSLIQSLREQNEKTEHDLRAQQTGPRASPARKPRRSSKPYVSRENVSPERARHLERNRIAASKCRIKKKKEHEQIQSILDSETARRETLMAQVNVLREEVWRLKNQMFEHVDCNDQRINLQLATMTQSILGANPAGAHPALKCPSPSFSFSTCSDGSVGNGNGDEDGNEDEDHGGINWGALENVNCVPDYQDGVFESFIDVPNM